MIFLMSLDDHKSRNYLEQLYENYKLLCYKIARNIVKTSSDSDDVVQQTYMKIAEVIQDKGMGYIKDEKAFIGKTATNTALKHLEGDKKHLHVDFDNIVEPTNSTFVEPEMNVLRIDRIRTYTKKLAQLNEGYAYIIMLKYSEGLTVPEIANLLGITEDTTRKRISRARIAYKNILKEDEIDD